MWFWDTANKRGICVPDIPHMYNGNIFFEAQGTIDKLLKEYNPRDWVGISAIAQHYNLPTRLLDWTYDMDAAIFFATRNITHRQIDNNPEQCFSIWEMVKPMVSFVTNKVGFVTPDYCDDPNISAQSGLFSFIADDDPGKPLEDLISESARNLNDGMRDLLFKNRVSILTRIDIPYSEIPEIRANLESRKLSYDRFFPNLSDVAKSMRIQAGLEGPCVTYSQMADSGIELFDHPNMIATIMFIHDNPGCI